MPCATGAPRAGVRSRADLASTSIDVCLDVPVQVGIMWMPALQLMPLRVCASLLVVVIALLAALVIFLIPASSGQSMAVPAFFAPGRLWSQVDSAVPTLRLVVVNPASGPGPAYDQSYGGVVRTAQKRGITVIGYVDTNYGARGLSAVESDVDKYYSWYHVNGIFFDRARPTVPWLLPPCLTTPRSMRT